MQVEGNTVPDHLNDKSTNVQKLEGARSVSGSKLPHSQIT